MLKLEKTFRMFTVDKLKALKSIADYPEEVITTVTISGLLDKQGQKLGGSLSSLARTKIEGEPILIPMSRSLEEGINWRFNEKIASKNEVSDLIQKILDENRQYHIAVDDKDL